MDEISPNCTRPVDIVGIFPIFFEMSEERRGRGYRNPRLRQNPVLSFFLIGGGRDR